MARVMKTAFVEGHIAADTSSAAASAAVGAEDCSREQHLVAVSLNTTGTWLAAALLAGSEFILAATQTTRSGTSSG